MKSLTDAARAWGKTEARVQDLRQSMYREKENLKAAEESLRSLIKEIIPEGSATFVRMMNGGAGVLIERDHTYGIQLRLVALDRVPDMPSMPDEEDIVNAS